MSVRRGIFPVLLLLSIVAPSNAGPLEASGPGIIRLPTASEAEASAASRGRLRMLTYNIAGLPEGISDSEPKRNIPRISPLLNDYDLVLVQEDFSFPEELRSGVELPHQSSPAQRKSLVGFGDGLSRFGRAPFETYMRVRWRECSGLLANHSDCLALKGFTVARHHLAKDAAVDVYNLHMDAGSAPRDRRTREAQVEQLVRSIAVRSPGRAVVVAGDTNLRAGESRLLRRLLEGTGLHDACGTVGCPDPGRIDRVLYRSGSRVKLEPRAWKIDPTFVDQQGEPLSDHLPVAVEFHWRTRR